MNKWQPTAHIQVMLSEHVFLRLLFYLHRDVDTFAQVDKWSVSNNNLQCHTESRPVFKMQCVRYMMQLQQNNET